MAITHLHASESLCWVCILPLSLRPPPPHTPTGPCTLTYSCMGNGRTSFAGQTERALQCSKRLTLNWNRSRCFSFQFLWIVSLILVIGLKTFSNILWPWEGVV